MVGVKKETRSATSAVGYIRVSTEEQVLGPDAQRVALEQWAVARQVELLAVFEDRGVSGATPLDRRPGLLAALECMAKSRAGWLVAAKRDRFARDVIIAAQLERLVGRDGGQLVSADGAGQSFASSAPSSRLPFIWIPLDWRAPRHATASPSFVFFTGRRTPPDCLERRLANDPARANTGTIRGEREKSVGGYRLSL